MATTKEELLKRIKSTPVVTKSISHQVEGGNSPLQQAARQQQVVTPQVQQQIESASQPATVSPIIQGGNNNATKNAPVVTDGIRRAVESAKESTPPSTIGTYAEMMAKLKDPTPTAEELEAERKRERRKAIFNAIGDGVSSLANLYFTTQGAPNSYNADDNMTTAQRERYDKMLDDRKKEQEQYFSQYLRLAQLDENARWRDLTRKDRQEQQARADAQWRENQERLITAAKAEADRWERNFEYKKETDEKDREAKAEEQKQQNSQFWATHNRLKDAAEARANASANSIRGKQLAFSDGKNNQVSIYENVWKPSMPEVFNAIIDDDVVELTALQKVDGMTSSEKEDFVKTNWTKSPKARTLMLALSKIDPATMGSQVAEDDDFSQYEEVDYSQYEE